MVFTVFLTGFLCVFFRPLAIALVVLILLQAIFILFDTMILCFRPHDNESAQLIKAGITSLDRADTTAQPYAKEPSRHRDRV